MTPRAPTSIYSLHPSFDHSELNLHLPCVMDCEWMCSCGASNYADRRICRRCSSPRGEGARGPDRNPSFHRPEWKCKFCHTSNFIERKECRKCRSDHKKSSVPPPPTPSTSREMWRCPQCLQNNLPRKDFCVGCKLQRQSEEDMDRRMAAHCSTSSLSPSSRPTPSASGDNSKAMLDDATKMGKEEKERQHDGRRLSNEGKNESRVRRHSKQEPKMKDNMSPGKKKSPTSKSWKLPDCTPGDSTSNIANSCASREQPSAVSSSRHTFHGLDPEWAAKMNARYGLEGQESPFSVVGEVKKERSPPRQPKRADETPPPTPPKPAQPLSKPQSIAKPHSDPYENEDEDPATAALRREIRETSYHSFDMLICYMYSLSVA